MNVQVVALYALELFYIRTSFTHVFHLSGQGEDKALGCSSLHVPQPLQSQRRSSAVRQFHLPPLQHFFFQPVFLQLHFFPSPHPGLPSLLGLCPLPHIAQRRTRASRPGSSLGPEPARSGGVCGEHGNGPLGVDVSVQARPAAPRSHCDQTF